MRTIDTYIQTNKKSGIGADRSNSAKSNKVKSKPKEANLQKGGIMRFNDPSPPQHHKKNSSGSLIYKSERKKLLSRSGEH